ncbi:MAG TPA: hypothetical protein PLD88_15370, partial [Candidatus Berkiella sp.]|nr:hypothetical protein [Candidatus Berkiella sp.]
MLGTSQYYPEKNKTNAKQMKFEYKEDEVSNLLNNLIKKDQERDFDSQNIRGDHEKMRDELLEMIMPFQVPAVAELA